MEQHGWRLSTETRAPTHSLHQGPLITLPADLDEHFTSDGSLVRPLTFTWLGGNAARLQTCFAEESLSLDVPLGESEGDASMSPDSVEDSDLCRIVGALKSLEAQGYISIANAASTSTGGWEEVAERSNRSDAPALFWNTQGHEEAFSDEGELIGSLPLQWRGDPMTICSALHETGLDVVVPGKSDKTFFIGTE
jgi:hypothetical protein